MSPGLEVALISGGFGLITLIGTLFVQSYGIRKTSADNEKARAQQSAQLDRNLEQQRERTLNERFTTIAAQLGDAQPAVRLAGAHAMARLAGDWKENRQPCVDVLCAYLRMPYDLDPGNDAAPKDRAIYLANREVRHTIIRLIRDHLRPDMDPEKSWQGLDLDFTGVIFDGGDFTEAQFSQGTVKFDEASFISGEVHFDRAEFSGSKVDFIRAKFSGSTVYFDGSGFSGSMVHFDRAEFSCGKVRFIGARFSDGQVRFVAATYTGSCEVDFRGADPFSRPPVVFGGSGIPPGVKLPAGHATPS